MKTEFKTDEEALSFLYNADNIERCDTCPYNKGASGVNQLPCGQYRCWVSCHCATIDSEEQLIDLPN